MKYDQGPITRTPFPPGAIVSYIHAGKLIGKTYKVLKDEGRNWVWTCLELENDHTMSWPIQAKNLVRVDGDEPEF